MMNEYEKKYDHDATSVTASLSKSNQCGASQERALTPYRRHYWHFLFTKRNPVNENFYYYYPNPKPRLIGDIIPTILSYCDAQTLSRASCVCHEWREIALSNDLWENLCRREFNVSAKQIKPSPDPTKLLYVWTYQRFREACRGELDRRDAFTSRSLGSSLPTIPISAIRSSM